MMNNKNNKKLSIPSTARELLNRGFVSEIKVSYFGCLDIDNDTLVAKIVKENDKRVVLILNESNSYEDTLLVMNSILNECSSVSHKLRGIIESSSKSKPVSFRMKPNLSKQVIIAR